MKSLIIKNLRQKLIFGVFRVSRKIMTYKYFVLFAMFGVFIGINFMKKIFLVEEVSQQVEVKQVIPVEVVKAEYSLGISNKLTTNGKTIAYETHPVKSNITGIIKELDCSVGTYVKKGDVLAIFDTEQIDYQIELTTQEYDIKKKKLDSLQKLLDKNLICYTEYANHKIEYLDVKQRFHRLLDDKTKHYIDAPLSGIVEEKFVVAGEFVMQKDKIVMIHDIQIIKIGFNIDELDYQKFKGAENSYIYVYIPALDLSFTLNDFKTSEIAQEQNHSVYIEALIPNDDNLITPGLFVNVDVIFSDNQQLIKLPNSAIFFEDYYFCYVIENDVAKKVEVEIIDSDNTNISVISPIIKSGDQVVVSGKKGLYNGDKVLIDNTSVISP
jgi:membrane fusion protein (multidrug efflux system)